MKPTTVGTRLCHHQWLRFGVVGSIGFVIDAGVLQLLLWFGLGPYQGRLLSFLAAATATWLLNRRYTFPHRGSAPVHREWQRYVALMTFGGAVNYGAYALCLMNWSLAQAYPAIGVAVGSLIAMTVNFFSAKYLVFRGSQSVKR